MSHPLAASPIHSAVRPVERRKPSGPWQRICALLFFCLLVDSGGLAWAALGFTAPGPAPATGASPSQAALGDLNGDTVPDAVTANLEDDTISVLLGNVNVVTGKGDGSFADASNISLDPGSAPASVAVADLNGDTVPDLVTANFGNNTISVLLGNVDVVTGKGDGTFQPKVDYSVGNKPASVAATDLNGDTVPDLVTANSGNNTISVLLGNVDVVIGKGDGTFQPKVDYSVGNKPASVAAADLNGDTVPDLVTADFQNHKISVLLGNVNVVTGKGDGTFQPKQDFITGVFPVSVVLADVNGDGQPDAVTANAGPAAKSVSILLGNGNGSFAPKQDFPVGGFPNIPNGAAVGDLNADGKPDVVASLGNDTLSVLLNQSTLDVTLNPTDVPFGNQPVGTPSTTPQAVTLSNSTGTTAFGIQSITVSGDFAFTEDPAQPCGTSLAAGASCILRVTFTPAAAGVRTGELKVTGTGGDPLVLITSLNGIGTVPIPGLGSVNPFDLQPLGTTSAAHAVTLRNTGNIAYDIASITADGDFAVVSHDCGTSLAAGAICTLQVTFTPTALGSRTGNLTVTGAGDPLVRSLSGIGVPVPVPSPVLGSIAPFGGQAVGTPSAAHTVTLRNFGGAAYGIASIGTSGDFAVIHDCGTSLAPGAICTLQVTFTPTAAGTRTGNLTVTGTTGSPLVRGLSGTGVSAVIPPPVTPVPTVTAELALKLSGAKSVKLGKTLTYTLSVANNTKRKVKRKLNPNAPDVVVTGELIGAPANGAVYTQIPAFCGVTGQTLTCRLGDLAPKRQRTFKVKVMPGLQGGMTYSASVAGFVIDPKSGNNARALATQVR